MEASLAVGPRLRRDLGDSSDLVDRVVGIPSIVFAPFSTGLSPMDVSRFSSWPAACARSMYIDRGHRRGDHRRPRSGPGLLGHQRWRRSLFLAFAALASGAEVPMRRSWPPGSVAGILLDATVVRVISGASALLSLRTLVPAAASLVSRACGACARRPRPRWTPAARACMRRRARRPTRPWSPCPRAVEVHAVAEQLRRGSAARLSRSSYAVSAAATLASRVPSAAATGSESGSVRRR